MNGEELHMERSHIQSGVTCGSELHTEEYYAWKKVNAWRRATYRTKVLNEQEIRTERAYMRCRVTHRKEVYFLTGLVVGPLDRPGRYISARPVCLHEGYSNSFALQAQQKLQRDIIGLGDISSLAYAPYLSIFALPCRCE